MTRLNAIGVHGTPPTSVFRNAVFGRHYTEIGAGNETRTRDPNLGKVVLYQLSYSRSTREGLVF